MPASRLPLVSVPGERRADSRRTTRPRKSLLSIAATSDTVKCLGADPEHAVAFETDDAEAGDGDTTHTVSCRLPELVVEVHGRDADTRPRGRPDSIGPSPSLGGFERDAALGAVRVSPNPVRMRTLSRYTCPALTMHHVARATRRPRRPGSTRRD